jgi:HEAT repeat protein
MKTLTRNPWLSWAVRGALLLVVFAWMGLYAAGSWQTRRDRGPVVAGRTLSEWDRSLRSDSGLVDSANSPEHWQAVHVLQEHSDIVVTEAAHRAVRRESLAEGAFFTTRMILLRKHFKHGEHEPAHRYRAQAARLLGAVGPRDPRVIPILCELLRNTDFYDYERGEAAEALNRMGPAAKPALPVMLDVLKSRSIGRGGPIRREMLIQAIALTGAKEAIPVLETLRNDPVDGERIRWAIERLQETR